MKKKWLSLLLCLAMVLSVVPAIPIMAEAAPEEIDGFVSCANWANNTYSLKSQYTGTGTSPVKIEFDMDVTEIDAGGGTVGYADMNKLYSMSHWSDQVALIQFLDGEINVYNGSGYSSGNVEYAVGTNHFRLEIDTSAKTYDVWYTTPGGTETQIANDAKFRSDSAGTTTNIGCASFCTSDSVAPFIIRNHKVNGVAVPVVNEEVEERDPSIITVGPNGDYATPMEAMGAAIDGDIIEIDAAGVYYNNDALLRISKKNITIRGVNGTPKMKTTQGVALSRKGTWLITQGAENITVENIAFEGAKSTDSDGNSHSYHSGIRIDSGLTNVNGVFTIRNCSFEDCDIGIQGGGENLENNETYDIIIENSEFHACGRGDGYSHGIYINNPTRLIYRYNYAHQNREGHLVKSRAHTNYVLYNKIVDETTSGTYRASANIDTANGGRAYIIGNILEKGVENGGANIFVVKYGLENQSSRGQELYVINNTMVSYRDPTWHQAQFVAAPAGTKVVVKNNIFAGGQQANNYNGSTDVTEAGNIVVSDPNAFFADAANHDYRLTPSCVNAIDQAVECGVIKNELNEDFDLTPVYQYTDRAVEARPDDGKLDIGAFEFVQTGAAEVDPAFGKIEFEDMVVSEQSDTGVVSTKSNKNASKGSYSQLKQGEKATYSVGKVQAANTVGLSYNKQNDTRINLEVYVNGVLQKELPIAKTNSYNNPSFNYTEFPVDFKDGDVITLKMNNIAAQPVDFDYIVLKNVDRGNANYVKVEAEDLSVAFEYGPNVKAFVNGVGGTQSVTNDFMTYSVVKREMTNPDYGVVDGAPKNIPEYPEVLSGSKYLQIKPFKDMSNDRNADAAWCKDRFAILTGITIPADGMYNFRLGMRLTNNFAFNLYYKDAGADDSTYQLLETLDQSSNTTKYGYVMDASAAQLLDFGKLQMTAGDKVFKVECVKRLNGNSANGYQLQMDFFEFVPASNLADPVAISDVAASISGDDVKVSFTAPEAVNKYDVRYSQYPITADSWGIAQRATVESPVEAGETQEVVISGLQSKQKYYFAVIWENTDQVKSPISNVATVVTADAIAPAAVSDLAADISTKDSVKLSWHAVGDDGVQGTAASYDLRYSTSPITAANFAQASSFTSLPKVQRAGVLQTVTVTGLEDETKYYFAIKVTDAAGNVSEISNVAEYETVSFRVPAKITNLVAAAETVSSVKLTWTAVGDDMLIGTAASYDVRYSTSEINDNNFASATKVANVSAPKESGSAEELTVTGLNPSTTYYFAMKVTNSVGMTSELSNTSIATTFEAGKPGQINTLVAKGSTIDSVTLNWRATGNVGDTGVAASYEVRYSTEPITEDNWDSATVVVNPPLPQAAGTTMELKVSGLDGQTTYYFAVKSFSNGGTASDISNVCEKATTKAFFISDLVMTDMMGNAVEHLTANSNVNISVSMTNGTANEQDAELIVALFGPDDAIKNMATAGKTLASGESTTLRAGFQLPSDIEGYYIKVFMWDNLFDMNPLTDDAPIIQ